MAEMGHETHIVTAPGETQYQLSHGASHQVHTIPIERNIAPLRDLLALSELTALLYRLQPDVVHTHGPKACLLGMLAATATGVPVRIASIHGLRHETLTGTKLNLVKNLETVSARLAQRVICVSHSVQRRAVSDGIVSPSKVSVLGQGSAAGVDAKDTFQPEKQLASGLALREKLGLASRDFVVGYVGRLARDKGITELTQAWRTVAQQSPQAHLILAGERDLTDPVSLDTLLSLPRVHELGFLEQPAQAYAALDLLVLPSYREGFPQVLLEAAAMGKPVLATQVTGCVDAIVSGETGVLVPAHDAPALAQQILALEGEPERRQLMGHKARQRVLTDFSSEPIAQATWDLYEELLRVHGRA